MREILFRGKTKDTGKWVYGSLLCFKGFSIHDQITKNFVTVDSKTVGQYTGFKDKNGKKIFEGDVMHIYDNVVEFCNGAFCINGDSPICFWQKTEILGNIHDNPRLVSEKGDW